MTKNISRGPFVVILGGPTGVGKSSIGLRLAEKWDTEIISADSRQIYQGLDIGTAKLPVAERKGIKHHFIDHITPDISFSAAKFEYESLEIIQKIHQKRNVCMVVGGTGLYIQALWKGLDNIPALPVALKKTMEEKAETNGLNWLQDQIKQKDPEYFAVVDLQNPRRLIRALACIEQTGLPYSSFLTGKAKQRPFNVIPILITETREILYQRLNDRVDLMIKQGLLDEARKFFPLQHLPSLQTVGYQELFAYFNHKIDLKESIRLIKRNSRRYAKRQMTWFRKHGIWQIFKPEAYEDIEAFISSELHR
jgi:tRNA dimethylallyltransferase